MIFSDLESIVGQIRLTPALEKALDFLRGLRHEPLPDGRIAIDGDRVYALVQSYRTAPPGDPVLFEAHRKYIDVQHVVAGEELIGWSHISHLTPTAEYDEAKEAWFGTLPAAEATFVRVAAGELAVLYPTDGHAPRLMAAAPSDVKKIVVKVVCE